MKLQANEATPRGFTLIELLVVIAIIGVLASMIIASLGTARDKARDAAIRENMLIIRTAAALYFSENNNYSNFPENNCPDTGGLQMFNPTGGGPIASKIYELIQQSELLYGGSLFARCAATLTNPALYAVAIPMKIQDAGTNIKYFCVDSSGVAKVIIVTIVNNAISGFQCAP